MDKVLTLDYIVYEDIYYEGINTGEAIEGKTDDETEIYFNAHNLCDCPEDATIDRDLFNAYDYVKALKLGMKLAKEGYTDIKLNKKIEKEKYY